METRRPITAMLVRLTAAKAVANGAYRWVALFLPTLTRAFGASTAQMTSILGIGETAGLATLLIGRHLDRGRERLMMAAAMSMVATGCLLAVTGRLGGFMVGYYILMMGCGFATVSGHTYLSRRVRFARRARVLGIFEMSWATSMLVGAPLAALLIGWVGWRGPFWFYAVAAVGAGSVLVFARDTVPVLDDAAAGTPDKTRRLTGLAWISIGTSGLIAGGGLTMLAIAGTWLSESFSVSTGGVGIVAMAFGAAELVASVSSAAGADRFGPVRSTRLALGLVLIGLIGITQAGGLASAVLALFTFFVGFEFAVVTSFSIVSEAMPQARGRVLATNTAVATVLRGSGVSVSGLLYERFGIIGPAAVGMVCASLALVGLARVAKQRGGIELTPEPVAG